MKYDKKTTFSGRFTDKIRNKFNEIDPAEESSKTTVQVIEEIIDSCEQLEAQLANTDQSNEVYENLLAEHNRLKERITEESTANGEELEELRTVVDIKNAEIEALKESIAELQAELDHATNPAKDKIIVTLQEPAATFMELTASRLSAKFERDVTPAEILTDLFVKYTIENPCDFAFPVVISNAEAKEIVKKFRNVR
ncbi:MAG: hypothetical protein MJ198_05190 [Bacteroidales bacterium]|nr:hypothetical protein [Bacteroidales bacterium]